MSAEENEKADLEIIQRAIDMLGDRFDTIQIFTTRYESENDGGTINVQKGTGNWFARYGHVKTWIEKVDEDSRERARRDCEGL